MIQLWSRAGSRHRKTGTENQDAVFCRETARFSVVTLADGVSTCSRSGRGARITCGVLAELLLREGPAMLERGKRGTEAWLTARLLRPLRRAARLDGRAVDAYSCTAAGVLVDRWAGRLLYFNLGDGMLLSVGTQGCRILSMPADSTWGCPVTTTRDAHLLARLGETELDGTKAVLLCTDGAWRSMFSGGRLKAEVRALLLAGDHAGLGRYLEGQESGDDASFAALELGRTEGRVWG